MIKTLYNMNNFVYDIPTKVYFGNDFAMMAAKACRDGNINGFKTLTAADVEKIYQMCL